MRAREPERFLCALFAPRERREAVFALTLLHHELASIARRTTEAMPALIRFQWWRDGIEAAAAGRPPQHPLPRALARPLAERHLTAQSLLEFIDAHEDNVREGPPADLAALHRAIGSTSGRLQALWARALGCTERDWLARAEAAGTAFGMTELARSWATSAVPPVTPVPLEAAHKEGPAQPVTGPPDEATRRHVVETLLASSDRLIATARAGPSPAAWLAALLPARVARSTNRKLRRARALPTSPAALRSPLLPLALVHAWARGKA